MGQPRVVPYSLDVVVQILLNSDRFRTQSLHGKYTFFSGWPVADIKLRQRLGLLTRRTNLVHEHDALFPVSCDCPVATLTGLHSHRQLYFLPSVWVRDVHHG